MTPETITDFWLTGVGPKGWYAATPELDADIRARFLPAWQAVQTGAYADWAGTAAGALALLILTDQFPRNMFRDDARSFATDALAVRLASAAIAAGHDLATPPPARQFFYLPFMHAEDNALQARGIELFEARMPGDNLRHARAHAEVIARFGRFPWRNAALGRASTAAEAALMAAGGYGAVLREMPAIADPKKIV
ncbi:MAG: DUF924 domain-containing protein [Alphaproteobacteria bacterium HGW-Alphaproteobacteria-4]|jgi:uncharacterized protein (DUF924 family)|nr:MAG: DUF924 domain-containing protein [Alphaproteobacteria bacterium HGW-Alphaproteobacteria-4]